MVRMELLKERGHVEAIDQQRCATRTVGMRKEVEELNTAWISKVSGIGVSTERHVRVRGVAFSKVSGKFPEFAVLD